MNFRNICALSVVAAMMLFAVPGLAQTTKLGFINMQKAVSQTTEGKAALKKLDSMQKRIETELKSKQDEILRIENELKSQGALMADETKRQKIQDYQKKAGMFQQTYQESSKKMGEEQQKLMTPIMARFEKIVAKLGKDENFTAILHGEVVLYGSPKVDLTDRIARMYNKGAGK